MLVVKFGILKSKQFMLNSIFDRKTRQRIIKKLLVIDNGSPQYGISSEVISIVSENFSEKINIHLDRLSIADNNRIKS